MDWTQTIALGGTLIGSMVGMVVFLYKINDKSIHEWRSEHKDQMQKSDSRFEKAMGMIDARFEKAMEKNEAHWREMFMYMNERFDKFTGEKK